MEQTILEQILDGSVERTVLPLEILREITGNFSGDRVIGAGGFGTVYKGVLRNGNVAVKRISSSMTIDEKLFRREVDSLMEVNHRNVVRFLGFCSNTVHTTIKNTESRGYIYAEIRERLLCFEHISNGSLDKHITDELRGLEWDTRYNIIKGICAGLHYLHNDKYILHMDLKPANILLDNQMKPKITDFGLSRSTDNSQTVSTSHFSSPGYGAPENMFGNGRMSVKSDIYSLGAIIIELVTGHKGIPDNKNNILRRWRHRWNKSDKETALAYQQISECIKIGILCQEINPYKRPSISDIMHIFDKMERLENNTTKAKETTAGQINPPLEEDDMLRVEPLELFFASSEHNNKPILSCSVELSNATNGFIGFKIETTSPFPYSIVPNKDVVKPKSNCRVNITLQATHDHHKAVLQSKQYKEEFIVRSIKVNEGLTTEDFNEGILDKHMANIDEVHLEVVSEEPRREEEVKKVAPILAEKYKVPLVLEEEKKVAPFIPEKYKVAPIPERKKEVAPVLAEKYKVAPIPERKKEVAPILAENIKALIPARKKEVAPSFAEKYKVAPIPARKKEVAPEKAPMPVVEAPKPDPKETLDPPRSKMVLDDWKRLYKNTRKHFREIATTDFWGMYDPECYSLWFCDYKYQEENTLPYVTRNKVGGFLQRMSRCRKYSFGKMLVIGSEAPFKIKGVWLFRGPEIPKLVMDEVHDMELYEWTKVDISNKAQKERVNAMIDDLDPFEGEALLEAKCFM